MRINQILAKVHKIFGNFLLLKSISQNVKASIKMGFGHETPQCALLSHSISNMFLQCFSSIIDRVNQNSLSMHFRRANKDLGGPIRIQEGQYGFSRASTEPSMDFRKVNTKPSMHFRRASTETY